MARLDRSTFDQQLARLLRAYSPRLPKGEELAWKDDFYNLVCDLSNVTFQEAVSAAMQTCKHMPRVSDIREQAQRHAYEPTTQDEPARIEHRSQLEQDMQRNADPDCKHCAGFGIGLYRKAKHPNLGATSYWPDGAEPLLTLKSGTRAYRCPCVRVNVEVETVNA